MRFLWKSRSPLDLVGTIINIHNGQWVYTQSSIGAGIDSFYEYLLKSYILFGDEDYRDMFDKVSIRIVCYEAKFSVGLCCCS